MVGLRVSMRHEKTFKKGDIILVKKKSLLKKQFNPYKVFIYKGIKDGKDIISELTSKGWKSQDIKNFNKKNYEIYYGEDIQKEEQLKKYKFMNYK
jgi:hypothetical protein